jgi:hypothetical protein
MTAKVATQEEVETEETTAERGQRDRADKRTKDGRTPKRRNSPEFCPPCSTTPVPIVKPVGLCALCEDDEMPSVITNECIVRLHPLNPLQVAAVITNGGERGEAQNGPVSVERREEAEGEKVTALLDTGASGHDFISPALAARLIERGAVLVPTRARACLAQHGPAYPSPTS